MRSLLAPFGLGLVLCLVACTRPSTLKVAVIGVPAQSVSLAVSFSVQSQGDGAIVPLQGLDPYELPQPAAGQTSFVLRLPLPDDATLLLGVAAFDQTGGSGCLLGLGNTTHPYLTAILDDAVEVTLAPYKEDASTGCQGSPRIVTVTPTALAPAGGETLQVVGVGFVPGTRIVLNGMALATRYVSSGQLEATTPPSARLMPVPMTVEPPGGISLSYQGLRYSAKSISFSPLTAFPVADFYHRVAIADFDGDQRPDLLFYPTKLTADNRSSIAFQQAPVQFTIQALDALQDVDGVQAVDIDGDGDIDLVAPDSKGPNLKLLYNDGHGAFTLKTQTLGVNVTALTCLDVDGDGAPEILFLDDKMSPNQTLYWLHNDGKGSFDAQQVKKTNLPQTKYAYSLVTIDYDLDGRIDLLLMGYNEFTVLRSSGSGLPADDSAAQLVQTSDSLSSFLSVADLDGDQLPDLLASDSAGIPVVYLSRSMRTRQTFRPACPSAVYAAADLDGDGLPDLAYGCDYENEIRFQRQLASHVLVSSSQAPPLTHLMADPYIYSLTLADLDADGRPELIYGITPNSGAGATSYHVYRNVSQ